MDPAQDTLRQHFAALLRHGLQGAPLVQRLLSIANQLGTAVPTDMMSQAYRAAPHVQQQQPASAAAAPPQAASAQLTSAQLTAQRVAHYLAEASRGGPVAVTQPKPASKKRQHESAAAAATSAAGNNPQAALQNQEDAAAEDGQAVGTDENEDGHTYAEYRAMQIRALHPDIMGHPDPLVETASLASVPLPPPSFNHSLHDCVEGRLLSDAQLETIVYANMKFSGPRLQTGQRAGFFLGDAQGSDSVPSGKGLERFGDGCLFVTYSLLISGLGGKAQSRSRDEGEEGEGAGRAPRRGKEPGRMTVPPNSRLAQIVRWLQDSDHAPLLVFDECHKAKNLLPTGGAQPTQTARAVVEIQELLPDAKVLYSSATGASEPRNLAYMTRLGLFGFKDAKDMIELLSKSKLGALELAAMSLKATGTYLSRTLSYEGAEFALGHVAVDEVFKVMYDRATLFWTLLWKIVQCHPRLTKLQGVFWSANQRFWKQLLMASKVPACAAMAKEAMDNGMAVVIGLQSTGEANTELLRESSGNSFDDLVSAPRMVLEQYVRTQFPMDRGGASQTELDSLEFQVFNAIQAWRDMLPASEVVAQKVQGQEVQHAAALMGLHVNKQDRRSENEIITMRAKMKRAAKEEEALRVERQRKEKAELWTRRRAVQERRLRLAKEQAGRDVADGLKAVARLQALADMPAGAAATLEDSSSDEEERQPLARRGSTAVKAGGGSAKRKAAVSALEDSEGEGSGGCKESSQRPSTQRKAKLRRTVLSESEDWSDSGSDAEEDKLPLSARAPLAPRFAAAAGAAGGGQQLQLAFRVLQVPVEIDLTLDGDLPCMICGQEDDEENMLLCDGCDRGCHTGCARLHRLPSSPTWFCCLCSASAATKKESGAAAAAAAPATQLPPQRGGRLKQEGESSGAADAAVTLVNSEDDSDLFAPPLTALKTTGGRMQLLAAERRLNAAQRRLSAAEQELEAFCKETAEGPPATPPARQLHVGPRLQQRGQLNSTSFDPTVRNLQLSSAAAGSYRHAVKVHGLSDLDLPAGLGLELARREAAQQAVQVAEAEEERRQGDDDLDDLEEGLDGGKDAVDVSPQLSRMRSWLLRIVNAMELPPNPLDQLIELLGGEERVAELTGRKGYVCREEGIGRAMYKQRGGEGPQKDVNMREKEAFMSGRKLVAIISDAASTGISLQADRRAKNQRRRCHITLELPWSADKAIQQFGRSHRANQVSAPLYRILTVPVGGEYRFASAAAKRLASLGALLRGDRNAIGAGSELKAFDIDNAHGERALLRVLQDVCGELNSKPMPGVKVPELPAELALPEFLTVSGWDRALAARVGAEPTPPFFQYMRTKLLSIGILEGEAGEGSRIIVPSQKAKLKIPRFLNRLLGLPMIDQELLFQYFTDTLDATVAQLKSEGKFDSGIVTIKGRSCKVVGKRPIHSDAVSGGEVQHVEISLDRGLPWEAALAFKAEVEDKLEEQTPNHKHLSGFYTQRGHDVMAGGKRRPYIVLATEILKSASNYRNTRFHIQRPNVGSTPSMTLQEMDEKRYRRIADAEAEALWRFWFTYSDSHCTHGDNCYATRHGSECRFGLRKDTMHLITGAVLPIWQKLERWHDAGQWGKRRNDNHKWPLRVVKTIQEDGSPLVGVEATCREELRYFEQCLAQPEVEPVTAQQAAARARAQSAAAAAMVASSLGGLPAYVPPPPKKRRGPKSKPARQYGFPTFR